LVLTILHMEDSSEKRGRGRPKKIKVDQLDPQHLKAVLIGIGIAAGLTKTDTGRAIGMEPTTVWKYEQEYPEIVNTIKAQAKMLISASVADQVADAKAILEKHYHKAIRNREEFLDHDDPNIRLKVSERTIDRYEGLPKQRIEQSGSVEQVHRVALPVEVIRDLKQMITASATLMLPPPSEEIVIEEDEQEPLIADRSS
jgi:hypothetical protein